MEVSSWRRVCLVLLAVVLLTGLGGCTAADEAKLWDLVWKWFLENLWPMIADRFDPITGAILKSGNETETIKKADELMAEGRSQRDPDDMDEAISLRPQDWTYRVSRGALALERGDTKGMDEHLVVAQALASTNDKSKSNFAKQAIAELEGVKSTLRERHGKLSAVPTQCEALCRRLAQFYEMRGRQTGNADDLQLAKQYQADREQCWGQ